MVPRLLQIRLVAIIVGFLTFTAAPSLQTPAPVPAPTTQVETVRAITPPEHGLPPEAASAGVTKFSFLAYGDTRGRRDGTDTQYEHSLIVDSMVTTIRRLAKTDYPVRFVVQSGDAVVNGRVAAQWNRSYIGVIDRLTTVGDVPYFFAPGNHDVTTATDLASPERLLGLRNLLDANSRLIPPDGDSRRLAGYPTYAFGYGNLFMVAIDSNIADDDVQWAWVKRQLEGLDRARYPLVMAFFHHPPFSSGPHGAGAPEGTTVAIRNRYEPLFRQHHVRMTIAGHEHLFEHWVERYTDAEGRRARMDHLVTGGGGAPLYVYRGEPDLRDYLQRGAAEQAAVEHLVKPGPNPGDNPYHYVVVRVDGDEIQLDVVGIDWGANFKPYHSAQVALRDGGGLRPGP